MIDEIKFTLTAKIITYLLPIIFLLGLIIPYYLGFQGYALLVLYITIPLMISFFIILYLKNKKTPLKFEEGKNRGYLHVLYSILYLSSILILATYDTRPMLYYGLISVMFVILVISIMSTNSTKDRYLILMEIVLLFINISYGISLKYFMYIGRTDPIVHDWYVFNIIQDSRITTIFGDYESFPLWHIFNAMLYKVLNISVEPNKIIYFAMGILYSSIIIITYYATYKLYKNTKISLLASLFLSVFTSYLVNSTEALPRGVSAAYLIVVTYLFLREKTTNNYITIGLVSISLIFIHHASLMTIFIILGLIWALEIMYHVNKAERNFSLRYIIALALCVFSYWVFATTNIVPIILSRLNFNVVGTGTSQYILSISELINYLQYSPFVLLCATGLILLLKAKNYSDETKIFGIIGLGLLALSIPGPLFIAENSFTRLSINRFMEYSFLFIVTLTGFGFYQLYSSFKGKWKILLIILAFVSCFASVSNDFIASDNPVVKRDAFYTFYLTKPEVTAIQTIGILHGENIIHSDMVTNKFYGQTPWGDAASILEINNSTTAFLGRRNGNLYFIRTSELQQRPLRLFAPETNIWDFEPDFGEGDLSYYDKNTPIWNNLQQYDKVVDLYDVKVYS